MLDVIIDDPKIFPSGNEVIGYVVAAIVVVLAVIITIKLINKKKVEK